MGAIKNTPAGKEGEGKQSRCKRRVEKGVRSADQRATYEPHTSMFFITKIDLKQLFYSKSGTITGRRR